jgi:hypothetical protein
MSSASQEKWATLVPPLREASSALQAFQEHARRLSETLDTNDDDALERALERALDEALSGVAKDELSPTLRAALLVTRDLARQRWQIRVTESGDVEVRRPAGDRIDPLTEKARIRNQELVKRNEQFRDPATKRFIESMIPRRGRRQSVYSLLRDGRELAASLRRSRETPLEERAEALRGVVDPYLQFVDSETYCEHTNLRLQAIWRYFRHTWTTQYVSTPGRTMAFIVRDKARENHPVIGIGALGSPVVQIRERDAWIGWHPNVFLEAAREAPTVALGTWLQKTIDVSLGELYVADLYAEELLTDRDLQDPSAELFARLIAYSEEHRDKHHRFASSREMKRTQKRAYRLSDKHWLKQAQEHLFKSKRALALAEMLRARLVLRRYLSPEPTLGEVQHLLGSREGDAVVKRVLRKAKADRVGIAMADITVCGAVPPYSPVLGGKLVSMLAASPEVISAYRSRYLDQESEIASSMAGRSIVRPADLVFLGTTSLYGTGSSQYNRLRMPADLIGGQPGDRLEYRELGRSEAYGTSHFSTETVAELVTLLQQSSGGQRVNSIFGEGVSPKLRKLRDGLHQLGFPVDELLKHGRERIVYGVPLARNFRKYLLGFQDTPDYLCSLEEPQASSAAICEWWTGRWLIPRIESEEVLGQVERHTTIRDGRYLLHGACVRLPKDEDLQPSIFGDLNY